MTRGHSYNPWYSPSPRQNSAPPWLNRHRDYQEPGRRDGRRRSPNLPDVFPPRSTAISGARRHRARSGPFLPPLPLPESSASQNFPLRKRGRASHGAGPATTGLERKRPAEGSRRGTRCPFHLRFRARGGPGRSGSGAAAPPSHRHHTKEAAAITPSGGHPPPAPAPPPPTFQGRVPPPARTRAPTHTGANAARVSDEPRTAEPSGP